MSNNVHHRFADVLLELYGSEPRFEIELAPDQFEPVIDALAERRCIVHRLPKPGRILVTPLPDGVTSMAEDLKREG